MKEINSNYKVYTMPNIKDSILFLRFKPCLG